MIVVDTNIIAYALIEGEHTPQARALWRHERRWRVPVFWRHELLNVLATYSRKGGMKPRDAKRLWTAACRWCRPMEAAVDMAAALQLAIEQELSAYDAQFVALAQSLKVPLVSEDTRLRRRCPRTVVSISDYLAP